MVFSLFYIMASKQSKQHKKDRKPEASADEDTELSMASIAKLLEQNRQALSSDFKAAVSSLEAKIDLIQSTISDHSHRISSLETNTNVKDEHLLALEKTCLVLSENNAKLKSKVTDLESRSRWNNIRIIGLPELIEGPRPSSFFSQLLSDVFGEEIFQTPPENYRAHRTLTAKPGTGEKPRAVIICLHRFQQKELIIREARAKRGNLKYQGNPTAVFEDYTPEVAVQRAQF